MSHSLWIISHFKMGFEFFKARLIKVNRAVNMSPAIFRKYYFFEAIMKENWSKDGVFALNIKLVSLLTVF